MRGIRNELAHAGTDESLGSKPENNLRTSERFCAQFDFIENCLKSVSLSKVNKMIDQSIPIKSASILIQCENVAMKKSF